VSLHVVLEVLFALSGLALLLVAVAVMVVVVKTLVLDRGRSLTRRPRRGREERPTR
jgi:hypothetical protein